jgi:hypothetical protein
MYSSTVLASVQVQACRQNKRASSTAVPIDGRKHGCASGTLPIHACAAVQVGSCTSYHMLAFFLHAW